MKSTPGISKKCIGSALEYDAYDNESIWLTVVDIVSMAKEYRARITESYWISRHCSSIIAFNTAL